MLRSIPWLAAVALMGACASYPVPAQRLAYVESTSRAAEQTGANAIPQAQLHLRLAHEGIAEAQALIANKENKRADYVLIRAQSDAELALAEANEQTARNEAKATLDQIATLRASTGTTTTTGAPIQEKKP